MDGWMLRVHGYYLFLFKIFLFANADWKFGTFFKIFRMKPNYEKSEILMIGGIKISKLPIIWTDGQVNDLGIPLYFLEWITRLLELLKTHKSNINDHY